MREKIEAFIREKGVTVCPPRGWSEFNPARGSNTAESWQPVTNEVGESSPLAHIAAAKVMVHLSDLAAKPGDQTERAANKTYALFWFFESEDFPHWCDILGVCPEAVRTFARRVEAREVAPPNDNRKDNKTPARRIAAVMRWAARKKAGLPPLRKRG